MRFCKKILNASFLLPVLKCNCFSTPSAIRRPVHDSLPNENSIDRFQVDGIKSKEDEDLYSRPYSIILMRHGESTFNAEGRFIGWADPPLSDRGEEEARRAAQYLKDSNYGDKIDEIYVSYLKRSIKSGWIVANELGRAHIPVHCDWRLNEQMYGRLQGQLKREVAREHGLELTQKWRRSYDVAPPQVPNASGYFPPESKYKLLTEDDIPESWCGSPQTESLKDTQARVWRLWRSLIADSSRSGKIILICGHANVIRALLKRLDNIDNESLRSISIPRAVPMLYELDEDMKPIRSEDSYGLLSGRFLASKEAVEARLKMESTECQLGLVEP